MSDKHKDCFCMECPVCETKYYSCDGQCLNTSEKWHEKLLSLILYKQATS